MADGNSKQMVYTDLEKVLARPRTDLRLFGKPELKNHRRLGVLLAMGDSIEDALKTVHEMRKEIGIEL